LRLLTLAGRLKTGKNPSRIQHVLRGISDGDVSGGYRPVYNAARFRGFGILCLNQVIS